MKLEVIALDSAAGRFYRQTEKIARRLARHLKQLGNIEVYLISGPRMRRLNRLFRKKDQTTNVLSFSKPKNFPGSNLGEIYLDSFYIQKQHANSALPDFVLQQCKRAHANNRKHCYTTMAFMMIHGVLHILGYDHQKKGDRIKMEREEVRLLHRISNS